MKEDVYSIIQFPRGLIDDINLMGNINDQSMRSALDRSIRRLNSIADANLGGTPHQTNPVVLKEIVEKINNDIERGMDSEWSVSELRTLAYNLSEFHESHIVYGHALELLDRKWNDRLYRGLNNYLMSHWNVIPKYMLIGATKMLQRHLNEYKGDNKRLMLQKKNIDFFIEGGPTRLAQLAKLTNVTLQEAPKIIGYSPSSLTMDYFSDVVLSYYQGPEILNKTEEIKSLLTEQSHTRRTRMLMSVRLVKFADKADENKQNQVTKMISNLLDGDVTRTNTWDPFVGATVDEVEKIELARIRVNQWMVKKVINVFFERCVQDIDRKNFWLQYVPHISQFKIAGSSLVRANLNSDERVSGQLNGVFRQTNQYRKETAALILWIKDKIFVEFSDVGALYVYKEDNPYIRRVLGKRIERIEDLKISARTVYNEEAQPLGQLIEILSGFGYSSYYQSYRFNEEGKLNHQGNWSSRLRQYMSEEMDIQIQTIENTPWLYV